MPTANESMADFALVLEGNVERFTKKSSSHPHGPIFANGFAEYLDCMIGDSTSEMEVTVKIKPAGQATAAQSDKDAATRSLPAKFGSLILAIFSFVWTALQMMFSLPVMLGSLLDDREEEEEAEEKTYDDTFEGRLMKGIMGKDRDFAMKLFYRIAKRYISGRWNGGHDQVAEEEIKLLGEEEMPARASLRDAWRSITIELFSVCRAIRP
ncbi:unnamed protein product [Zymoseptoria tritici ST99CH_3D1]|uniref:Uncharacterized protein n=1 Tax=Zymoseptoria tritici ST99CH_1E4 TaxID=1276532 RepID=A0A2H1GZ62_ZYMTR|nr:unnamed protein product [Zymoseptoria tritici ST99CH_1E4]SMR62676.1 unnamed protein product [Zymoseptoria tritici ST99CH_3D1]